MLNAYAPKYTENINAEGVCDVVQQSASSGLLPPVRMA